MSVSIPQDVSRQNPNWLIAILGALVAFAPLSIDMYLPALPEMGREFGASAGQYTLAAYFIGMALGQCLYGPLSDRFGRKLPLYVGLTLYVLASAGCALAPDLPSLLVCRFVQALGGCAGLVIPLAMVRDLFDPQMTARVLSRLMLVMGVAPMLAPLAGSQLLQVAGWRAIFWVLAASGLAGLLAIRFGLQESLPPQLVKPVSVGGALRTFGQLLADRHYLGHALAGAFASAGMFAYIAGSPSVLITLHGLSPQAYSWVFGINALGLITASQFNHRLLATRSPEQVLTLALWVMAVCGLGLFAAGMAALTHSAGLLSLLLPLFGFVMLIGFVGPNTSAGAMAGQAGQAGSASALLGTLRFAIATVAGASVGLLDDGTARPMGLMMALCGGAALACYLGLARSSRVGQTA